MCSSITIRRAPHLKVRAPPNHHGNHDLICEIVAYESATILKRHLKVKPALQRTKPATILRLDITERRITFVSVSPRGWSLS